MTVAIHTVGVNTGNVGTWNSFDALNLLGIGMSLTQMHGEPVSGLVVGISSITGGGIVTNISSGDIIYQDVRSSSTTGIGTGASFYVRRESDVGGGVYSVNVNRPGVGYTGGEIVTISAEDIGGSVNGATDLTLKLSVDADISNGIGCGITFYGTWTSEGFDRTGIVGFGTGNTYTIREGDTLTIRNAYSNISNNTRIFITRADTPKSVGTATTRRLWEVADGVNDLSTISWTPSWGSAGSYYLTSPTFMELNEVVTLIIEPADINDVSVTSYGSTTNFIYSGSSAKVLKLDVDSNKKYGTTYHALWVSGSSGDTIYSNTSSGFFPIHSGVRYPNYTISSADTNSSYSGGHGAYFNGRGAQYLDQFGSTTDIFSYTYNNILTLTGSSTGLSYDNSISLSTLPTSLTGYELNLNVYRSGIDPNFVVFSWYLPTLSTTTLSGRTYGTFFLHNFTSNIFNLDHVFLSTATQILRQSSFNHTSGNQPYIELRTYLEGCRIQKRGALSAYIGEDSNTNYVSDIYETNLHSASKGTTDKRFYYRPFDGDPKYVSYMTSNSTTIQDRVDSNAAFNAVIKNIPLSTELVPCPYYLPEDFVFVQFDYNQLAANIQQGDTITLSGSEVYTVIDGSYDTDENGRTCGLLFCARTS